MGTLCLAVIIVGCGGDKQSPVITPELTPAQQESVKKATQQGGGPGMIQKMKKEGKTKPD